MFELQKVFDEIKIGFFLWFHKQMCNQTTRLHAATYDRVVLVLNRSEFYQKLIGASPKPKIIIGNRKSKKYLMS